MTLRSTLTGLFLLMLLASARSTTNEDSDSQEQQQQYVRPPDDGPMEIYLNPKNPFFSHLPRGWVTCPDLLASCQTRHQPGTLSYSKWSSMLEKLDVERNPDSDIGRLRTAVDMASQLGTPTEQYQDVMDYFRNNENAASKLLNFVGALQKAEFEDGPISENDLTALDFAGFFLPLFDLKDQILGFSPILQIIFVGGPKSAIGLFEAHLAVFQQLIDGLFGTLVAKLATAWGTILGLLGNFEAKFAIFTGGGFAALGGVFGSKLAVLNGTFSSLWGIFLSQIEIISGVVGVLIGIAGSFFAILGGKFQDIVANKGLSPSARSPVVEMSLGEYDEQCFAELYSCNMELILSEAVPLVLEQSFAAVARPHE